MLWNAKTKLYNFHVFSFERMGCIKVEIGFEVNAPALLTFWNVPLPTILIRKSNAVYFWKLPDLTHENSS